MTRLIPLSLLCLATAAPAQDAEPGAGFFDYYCATCHGTAGDGTGPLARFLTIEVPDLTGLALRSGGTFPMAEVVHQLDGTREDALHNGPMPDLRGVLLDEQGEYADALGALLEARGVILSIALYLEGIQRTSGRP